MRYFLVGWILLVAMVMGVMGFRGSILRKPPLEVFPDMDRQLKVRPQEPSGFFADNRGSRIPVVGTVARAEAYASLARTAENKKVFPFENHAVNTGFVAGTTNFVEVNPMQIGAAMMARGRQRYQINCVPCHGALGDGNGVTKKLGMAVVANLHDQRIAKMTDGELFHVISQGRNLMGSYAAQISVEDRWAIIAYLRALQLSRLGTLDEVPEQYRASLKK